MTYKQFADKLIPYFSIEEIRNINNFYTDAAIDLVDVYGIDDAGFDEEDYAQVGRDIFIQELNDGLSYEYIQGYTGGTIKNQRLLLRDIEIGNF